MPKYIVGIVHTALSHYSVECPDEETAKKVALAKFRNSESEVLLGNEYDEPDQIFVDPT